MKRGAIWIVLTCLIVTSLVLASCGTSTTSTPTSTTTTTTATAPPITTTTTTATAPPITTTTTTTGNWWDSLGKPQYGGEIVLAIPQNITKLDPYLSDSSFSIMSAWLETLFSDDWTMDPKVFTYQLQFRPNQYATGQLAESWEFSNQNTFVVHLRQNVYWQNIPPVNGRQFIASDVAYHYQRLYGLGSSMPGSPYQMGAGSFGSLISVTATDKYTVAFVWKISNPEAILEALQAVAGGAHIAAPEPVQQWGNLNDWHNAIGTGPFILNDFVSGSSATLIKNPNYWGYDERYPQNKLPYVDTLKYLIIPDTNTAIAAMRTGKIDAITGLSVQQAHDLVKTNPALVQLATPITSATTVDPRNDVKPFSDIRVREAMQMAIDLPTIAKDYYGGDTLPYPSGLTSIYLTGWGFPYTEWPQDLKDEYAYNPTLAKKLLADAGYPNGFSTNIVADTSGDMALLEIVKSYFADIGINMTIRPMDDVSWTAFVRVGHKQDQIVFPFSASLGMTHEPLRQLSRFATNYVVNWCYVSDPVYDAFLPTAMAATNLTDIMKVVSDANEYVARQHFCISLLQPNSYNVTQPWFKGYNGQMDSVNAGAAGPGKLFFYLARFWIDQNMKKSMGY